MSRDHRKESTVLDLVQFIEENLQEEISIPELASEFSLSPWYLQRVFKNITGTTLGSYLKGRRLSSSAKKLKGGSKRNILDLALDSGFGSHEAFTRSFKQAFSVTPKDYRLSDSHLYFLNKPRLTDKLIQLQSESLDLPPKIFDWPEIQVVGLKMSLKSPLLFDYEYEKETRSFWREFLRRLPDLKISKKSRFLGISLSPSRQYYEEEIEYLVGVEVSDFSGVPDDFTCLTIPPSRIAVFQVKNAKNEISDLIDYMYGHWLFDSKYRRSEGDDFEIFGSDYNLSSDQNQWQYAIPVEPK